jgi:hypothetical protein
MQSIGSYTVTYGACKAQHRREFELPSEHLLLAQNTHVLSVESCALVLFGYRAAMC